MVSVVNLQTEHNEWVALAVAVGSVVLGRAVRAVAMRPGASMGSTNYWQAHDKVGSGRVWGVGIVWIWKGNN